MGNENRKSNTFLCRAVCSSINGYLLCTYITSIPLTSLSLLKPSSCLDTAPNTDATTRTLWGTSSGSDVLLKTFFPLLPWLWGSGNSDSCNPGAQVTSAQPQPCPSPLHSPPGPRELSKDSLHALPCSAEYLHFLQCFCDDPNVPQTALQLFIFLILLEG